MKKLLFGLAALPFLAGVALAAEPLSGAQMDRITGGQVCTPTATGLLCIGTGTGTVSVCTGCPPGTPPFMPTSPQTFLDDLNKFLSQAGFKPGP
jgi:hypothetical protein